MKLTLRRFNNLLSVVVIGLGLYISLTPFLPSITFIFQDKSPEARAPYAGALADVEGSSTTAQTPDENRLVIPSIQVDEPILEGSNIGLITNGGTWRRPTTATPFDDNNTVIVGHRWYGNNISTFYHLDKVEVGQQMAVYWEGEEILYEVTEKKIVDPAQVEIEAPTAERQLTLYTCDPVWTAKNRLVIVAKPVLPGNQDSENEAGSL
jgi:LPXTG-site transpeptidase (sortase) family protein